MELFHITIYKRLCIMMKRENTMWPSSFSKNVIFASLIIMVTSNICVFGYSRTVCYNNEQKNCNEEFIDVYKNLSKSSDGLTDATTYFWLFTRKNPEEPEMLHKCGGRLPPSTNFNPKNELILILNPYIAGICDFAVYREWIEQILQKGEYNILAVDWSWGSKEPYHTAVDNCKIAAKQTVIVLRNIQHETGITKDKISIVGHSLSAHMAGFIGQGFPVGRITGLEPSGPSFNRDDPLDERLDATDADFVDVWHCNAGDCLPYLGINYDAGDVDFWINGGTEQSSCKDTILKSFLTGDFLYALENVAPTGCSHIHCSQYYKMSINPGKCQFVGVKCDNYEEFKNGKCHRCGKNGENCLVMGFDAPKYLRNKTEYPQRYYVETARECPYCNNSHIDLQGFSKNIPANKRHQRCVR